MTKFKKVLYGDAYVNSFIAEMEGQTYNERPFAFKRDDELYTHITGGIALPSLDKTGFFVTVGVNKSDQTFQCIDEFESKDEFELIKRARDIQEEYGHKTIQNWWGDAERLMTIINESRKEKNPVLISSPADFDHNDAFQIYYARLMVSLRSSDKVLHLNDCNILKSNIIEFVKDKTSSIKENPSVAMMGWLVHTLFSYRPWEYAVESIRLIPTTDDGNRIATDTNEAKAIHNQLYGSVA